MKCPHLAVTRDDFQPREQWAKWTSSKVHFRFHKCSTKEKVRKVIKHRTFMGWYTLVNYLLSKSSIVSTYVLFQSRSNRLLDLKLKMKRRYIFFSGPHRLNIIHLPVWKYKFLAHLCEWKNICNNDRDIQNLNAKEWIFVKHYKQYLCLI